MPISVAVWSPLKLPSLWAVFRDVLLLALSNTGAVVAMKTDTQIHRKHEPQHLDSSPEACHPGLPVMSGDIQLLSSQGLPHPSAPTPASWMAL